MKKFSLVVFQLLLSIVVFGQKGMFKGRVVNGLTNAPINEALIIVPKAKISTTTNGNGVFTISNLSYGSYEATIEADGYEKTSISFTISDKMNSEADIKLEPIEIKKGDEQVNAMVAPVTDDAGNDDDGGGNAQNVGSVLNSGRDPFINASNFSWGAFFFRNRGYENQLDNNQIFINGLMLNDLEEGNAGFSNITGLNDVMRSRSNSFGLQYNEVGMGSLGLTTSLDVSAASQRKQTRITFSNGNRSYRNRLMLTHNSGLNKKGWAYSLSFSRRWANEGPVPGTYVNAASYFAAIEKKYKKHNIGLTLMGAPTERGRQAPTLQEVYDLTGSNTFNVNWGWQEGKKRNARVLNAHNPIIMLNDEIIFSGTARLSAAISYQNGRTANSTIDWYNADNPRPDYYRFLPSYWEYEPTPEFGQMYIDAIKNNPNLLLTDWNKFYQSNNNIETFNGVTGKRSAYILANDVEANRRWNGAVNYEQVVNDHTTIFGGLNYQNQKMHSFREVKDLLGGDYFLNLNQFGTRNFPNNQNANQFDLKNPNRVLREGDDYAYNFNTQYSRSNVWLQSVHTYNKVDFFLHANATNNRFYRVGNYQSGIYESNSFGKSAVVNRMNLGAKGGVTYKINGRNYLYMNGGAMTRAPYFDNVFISARTRNEIASNITDEKVTTMEAGYLLRYPNLKGRFTFYATEIKDAMDIKRYFDDVNLSLVNLLMTGINKRYTGVESGLEFKASKTLSFNFAAALGQAFYTSRPTTEVYIDNVLNSDLTTGSGTKNTAYISNYYLPSGPQTASTLGFYYRSPKFWWASANVNYMDRNYIDFAPNVRTPQALGLVKENFGEEIYNQIVQQKKLNSATTLDMSIGKSWLARKIVKKAPYRSTLNLNLGINNALNNKNIQLTGFEQLRFDQNRPKLFGPRYMYAIGRQYFINLAYTF